MKKIREWTSEEKEALCKIALANSQVLYILGDADVSAFIEGSWRMSAS